MRSYGVVGTTSTVVDTNAVEAEEEIIPCMDEEWASGMLPYYCYPDTFSSDISP